MITQVQIVGLYDLNGFLKKLPKNLNDEISRESELFMKDVLRGAKLRVPIDTGELKNSLHVEMTGEHEWTLFVDSPHGVFQEEGFEPHPIHVSMIKGSNKLVGNDFFFVSKYTPFITPSIEHNLNKLSQRLEVATNKGIKKSGR